MHTAQGRGRRLVCLVRAVGAVLGRWGRCSDGGGGVGGGARAAFVGSGSLCALGRSSDPEGGPPPPPPHLSLGTHVKNRHDAVTRVPLVRGRRAAMPIPLPSCAARSSPDSGEGPSPRAPGLQVTGRATESLPFLAVQLLGLLLPPLLFGLEERIGEGKRENCGSPLGTVGMPTATTSPSPAAGQAPGCAVWRLDAALAGAAGRGPTATVTEELQTPGQTSSPTERSEPQSRTEAAQPTHSTAGTLYKDCGQLQKTLLLTQWHRLLLEQSFVCEPEPPVSSHCRKDKTKTQLTCIITPRDSALVHQNWFRELLVVFKNETAPQSRRSATTDPDKSPGDTPQACGWEGTALDRRLLG